MSAPVDSGAFSLRVTEDYTWRIREISDLKVIIRYSGDLYSPVARKAALALLYAHWEGHVLFVAEAYLRFIARKKQRFSQLMPSLQAVKLASLIQGWQSQRDSILLRLKIVDTIRSMDVEQFRTVPLNAINTGGNLNSHRFENICQTLMLDIEKIIPDRDYLDESIVGARNRIAHGDYFTVSDDQMVKAIEYVLEIMRQFRTEVENSVALKKYLRSA
jgi:HEPN superfamily protein